LKNHFELGGSMKPYQIIGLLVLCAFVSLSIGCNSIGISRNDFEVKGNSAFYTKHIESFFDYSTLLYDIAKDVVDGMKVVEENPDLKATKEIVFTYTFPLEDRYGNESDGIGARVIVPVTEWFKYSEQIRGNRYKVEKKLLGDWIVRGLPASDKLLKELSQK
jgi:hypothetical protein